MKIKKINTLFHAYLVLEDVGDKVSVRKERPKRDYSMNNQTGLSSADTPSAYIHVHLVCGT